MKNAPCVARRLGAPFCDGPPSAALPMASKKKLSDWKERIAKGAKLPGGFTPTGWSLPGEGLPQIGGSLFGCPVMATVNGEEVQVHCPKCSKPVVLDLQTLMMMGVIAVDPERRDAAQARLERGEMVCAMCSASEQMALYLTKCDEDGILIQFEGLEIWTLDKDERVVEKCIYAGPALSSKLKETLEEMRTAALWVIRAGSLVRVFAVPAGSKSWKDHYAI